MSNKFLYSNFYSHPLHAVGAGKINAVALWIPQTFASVCLLTWFPLFSQTAIYQPTPNRQTDIHKMQHSLWSLFVVRKSNSNSFVLCILTLFAKVQIYLTFDLFSWHSSYNNVWDRQKLVLFFTYFFPDTICLKSNCKKLLTVLRVKSKCNANCRPSGTFEELLLALLILNTHAMTFRPSWLLVLTIIGYRNANFILILSSKCHICCY